MFDYAVVFVYWVSAVLIPVSLTLNVIWMFSDDARQRKIAAVLHVEVHWLIYMFDFITFVVAMYLLSHSSIALTAVSVMLYVISHLNLKEVREIREELRKQAVKSFSQSLSKALSEK